jgi:hypothetical protein
VRDILAPEVAAGTVTAQEVDGVLDRKARTAFRKSAPDRRARRARKHLRRTVLDLTLDLAEARGADTPAVDTRGRRSPGSARPAPEPGRVSSYSRTIHTAAGPWGVSRTCGGSRGS